MEDNLVYLIQILLAGTLILSFKSNKLFSIINLAIAVVYSLPLYYCLFFHFEYGSGFLWWFYLIILSSIHLIVTIVYLIVKQVKGNNPLDTFKSEK